MTRVFLITILVIANFALASCDSTVSISWEKKFSHPVDSLCVERVLSSVAKNIHRESYISDGMRGFPKGVNVTQFGYDDPMGQGYYNVDVATLPDGSTQYYHGWEKIGGFPSEDYKRATVSKLNSNNGKLAALCAMNFDQSDFSN